MIFGIKQVIYSVCWKLIEDGSRYLNHSKSFNVHEVCELGHFSKYRQENYPSDMLSHENTIPPPRRFFWKVWFLGCDTFVTNVRRKTLDQTHGPKFRPEVYEMRQIHA